MTNYMSKNNFLNFTSVLKERNSKTFSREPSEKKSKANLTLNNSSNKIQISQTERSYLSNNIIKNNYSENNNLEYKHKSSKDKNNSQKNMNLINFLSKNSDKYEIKIIYDKKKKKNNNSKSNRNDKLILKLLDNDNSSEEEKSEKNINNTEVNNENNNFNYDFDNKINKELPPMIKPIFSKRHSIYFNPKQKINEEPITQRRQLKKYLSSKGIKYIGNRNIYQNNFFNSSNDAISTDTNLVNNKTYTTINTNNTYLEGNYSLQTLFNRNFKKNELIKLGKNDINKNKEKELLKSNSESDNNNNNNSNSNNISNNNSLSNSIINSNSNNKSNSITKSDKSSCNQEKENQIDKQNEIDNMNKNKGRRQSVFLTKLKINIQNKQLNNFKKKRSQQLNSTFNLGDDKSFDEIDPLNKSLLNNSPLILNHSDLNYKLHKKGPYEYNTINIKTAKKIFKKQLSKIPELSLNQEKRKSYLMSEIAKNSNPNINNNSKEILDKKTKGIKKTKTPEKNGLIYFKKIIDKITKINSLDSYDKGMDASYSQISTEKNIQNRKKERNKTVLTLSSINFLNLRTSSVRNSKSNISKLSNFKKKNFIQFFQKDINFDEKDISINNIKDDLIVKTTSYIDKISSNNKISDNFLTIILNKYHNYDKDVENYILRTKEKDLFKIEKKIIKKMNYYVIQNNFINNVINILLDYFKISLYDQIFKGKYLETDIGEEKIKKDNLLIKNFTINIRTLNTKKKFKKASLKNKVLFKRPSLYLDKKCFKFFNYLLIRDNPIFYDKDINIHEFIESLHIGKKLKLKTIKPIVNSYYEKKNTIHSRLSSKNNVKSSKTVNIKNNSSKRIIHLSKQKINILSETFYERKRNSFLNHKIYSRELKNKLNENIIFKKKNAALFISPNNYTEHKPDLINFQLRKEDKNYTVLKTMKIKEDILKSCSNYKDVLFLYIKDNNINGFKKIFEKYKSSTEIKDNEGNTLLNVAVQCGFKNIVSYLLYLGANPNTQNFKLNTPLHYALSYQYFDIADILLKNGAKEEFQNEEGLTAWQCVNSQKNNINEEEM